MRLGVFGGSFDPVHIGHLILAAVMADETRLDRVLFIPARIAPHKQDLEHASGEHRFEMLRLAVADYPGFSASDLELRREGVSFTADTLRVLHAAPESRDADLYLLMGMDTLLDLPNWHQPDDVARLARFLVAKRPDHNANLAEDRFLRNATIVHTPSIGISSSEIRARVREGKSIRFWVPGPVERFIFERGLYR
jgi:nicotinate-nucleotide adenylyltransferase